MLGGFIMMNETIRVNTRLAVDLNDWFDEESRKTGLSKSSLIMMAADNYRKEKEVMKGMADMSSLVAKIEQLEIAVQRKGLE